MRTYMLFMLVIAVLCASNRCKQIRQAIDRNTEALYAIHAIVPESEK